MNKVKVKYLLSPLNLIFRRVLLMKVSPDRADADVVVLHLVLSNGNGQWYEPGIAAG